MREFRSRWDDWQPEESSRERPSGALTKPTEPISSVSSVPCLGVPSEKEHPGTQAPDEGAAADLDPPIARVERRWRSALADAQAQFAAHGVEPSPESLRGAAALALNRDFNLVARWDPDGARRLLEAVYAGRMEARLLESGWVSVRSTSSEPRR